MAGLPAAAAMRDGFDAVSGSSAGALNAMWFVSVRVPRWRRDPVVSALG